MSASKDTLSCPVCKLDGFVIAELPQTCRQCGWRVELLIGQISEAYRAKLAAAREEWQAGGGALGRAKRLAGLFDKAADHWRAGRWAEALGVYDEISKLNPVNARAARERPAALFCLMESLFLDFARSQRDQLRQANERDQAERDKRRAEAAQFESVGMRPEAQEASRKAEALEQAIAQREAEARDLTESVSGWYAAQWQNSGPESLPQTDSLDIRSILALPNAAPWTAPAFLEHIWQPLLRQTNPSPTRSEPYFKEFCKGFELEIEHHLQAQRVQAERSDRAHEALSEARELARRGRLSAALRRLEEAEHDDPAADDYAELRRQFASLQADSDAAARRRRQAIAAPARRAALGLLLLAAVGALVWAVAWAWPRHVWPLLSGNWLATLGVALAALWLTVFIVADRFDIPRGGMLAWTGGLVAAGFLVFGALWIWPRYVWPTMHAYWPIAAFLAVHGVCLVCDRFFGWSLVSSYRMPEFLLSATVVWVLIHGVAWIVLVSLSKFPYTNEAPGITLRQDLVTTWRWSLPVAPAISLAGVVLVRIVKQQG